MWSLRSLRSLRSLPSLCVFRRCFTFTAAPVVSVSRVQTDINRENLAVLLAHYERFRVYYHGEVEALETRIRLQSMHHVDGAASVTDMTRELHRQINKERHLHDLVASIKVQPVGSACTAVWHHFVMGVRVTDSSV